MRRFSVGKWGARHHSAPKRADHLAQGRGSCQDLGALAASDHLVHRIAGAPGAAPCCPDTS